MVLACAAVSGPVRSQEPPPQWTVADADALLEVVTGIAGDGLNPADYEPQRLRGAILSQRPGAVAEEIFLRVASDLDGGRDRHAYRPGWRIIDRTIGPAELRVLLTRALSEHMIAEALAGLAPRHPQYRALKAALAAAPPADKARRDALMADLERWRWLPPELGDRYLLVNVPAYEVQLVEAGKIVARHRVIVGKPATPTPQFIAEVTGITFNPSWIVPASIIAESIGRLVTRSPATARLRGYVWTRAAKGGLAVTQKPGPGNALGLVKFEMPNPNTIYLHDTPSKELFDRDARAFSHGCIRLDRPLDLAETLLAGRPDWARPSIDAAVMRGATVTAPLTAHLPIYVVYFTMVPEADGQLTRLHDVYARNASVIAGLKAPHP